MTDDEWEQQEFLDRLERFDQACMDRAFDEITSQPDEQPWFNETEGVPAPGYVHPAYRHLSWLWEWINEAGPHASHPEIRIPRLRRITYMIRETTTATEAGGALPVVVLSRRLAGAPAPYVGQPYHYEWWAASDAHGRWIASEARRVKHRVRAA